MDQIKQGAESMEQGSNVATRREDGVGREPWVETHGYEQASLRDAVERKPAPKWKLLAICDSPHLTTGFGRVARQLLKRWADSGRFERIDIWGIGFNGYPGVPGKVGENWWERPPFVRYGPLRPEYWTSFRNMQDLLTLAADGDYTHVWVVQDHFQLVNHKWHEALRRATTRTHRDGPRKDVRTLFYCPVDAEVEPQWAAACHGFDCVVAYTDYGKRELERQIGALSDLNDPNKTGDGEFGPRIRVLPHGVEETFRPLGWTEEERNKERAECFGGFVQPGDIVLVNVNCHQRRKDVGRTLELLAELKGALKLAQGPVRFKLVMHMNRRGANDDSTDLEMMAEQLGLVKNEDWIHLGHLFQGSYGTLTDEELNRLYNCSDIYVTTTLGEGWGLGITEAAAAGCTVAIPEHTACLEIGERLKSEGVRVCWLPVEEGRVFLPADMSRGRRRVDVRKGVHALLERAAKDMLEGAPRRGLSKQLRECLSWDRIAEQWLKLMEGDGHGGNDQIPNTNGQGDQSSAGASLHPVVKRADHFYIELGGGLGDVFNGLYHHGTVNLLRDLPERATATVALVCSNPYAHEIFDQHPKVRSGQIQVLDLGYWDGSEDREKRAEHRLPRRGSDAGFERPDLSESLRTGVAWHGTAEDQKVLAELWESDRPYLVIAAGAGLNDRTFPQEVLNEVARTLNCLTSHRLVVVGRTFDRCGKRHEPLPEKFSADLRDKLTVPGTAMLLQRAAGLVTAHSALNLLGWNQDHYHGPKLPQLLLYPESVLKRHFWWTTEEGKKAGAKRDQWSWGADNGRTVHGLFGEWKGKAEEFLGMVDKRR